MDKDREEDRQTDRWRNVQHNFYINPVYTMLFCDTFPLKVIKRQLVSMISMKQKKPT